MAELRLKTIDEAELDTVIGGDIEFNGTIRIDHPALIKGRVRGNIESTSDIFIHQSADVEAEIVTSTLSVKGPVRGKLTIAKRLELYASGVVSADVTTPDLFIQSGARFNGTCAMPEQVRTNDAHL